MDANSKIIPFELHPMGFIELFLQFGANLDSLLNKTGINPAMFGKQGFKISYQQQSVLISNGIASCNTPGIGLLIGMHMDWSYHGIVGGIVACSPSLQLGGEALRRYLTIAQPYYAMYAERPSVYIDRNGRMVNPLRFFQMFNNNPELNRFEIEYRLAVTARVFDLCGNKSVAQPTFSANLNFPQPEYANLYQQLPCEKITFNEKHCAISCHYEFITTPWRELRRGNYDRLIELCEAELKKTNINTSFTSTVRWHIGQNFNLPVTLEEVAAILSTSPRALSRKLAMENTSFRKIAHDLRMELTALHLQSSRLSVEEVAELMGFSSGASLRRSIKNWSGKTAGDLRTSTLLPIWPHTQY
jgi:AraC-like DNA-binding protein